MRGSAVTAGYLDNPDANRAGFDLHILKPYDPHKLLAIVRNLVLMHEGTVEAHSEGPGRGSTFVVDGGLTSAYITPE